MSTIGRAAILPALGIGDALLMMIAAYHLNRVGYEVTCYHDQIAEMAAWFPFVRWAPRCTSDEQIASLSAFDSILIENDNNPLIPHWKAAAPLAKVSCLYPTYRPTKHGALKDLDRVFDPTKPMADNIGTAICSLLGEDNCTTCNGIQPLPDLIFRRYRKRILLHPTSRECAKNWLPSQFIALAKRLQDRGFSPQLCVSPHEHTAWEPLAIPHHIPLPLLPTLSDLASYIYESGAIIGNDSFPGHLASNLHLPTITLANDHKRMRLWRPGWHPGELLCPPSWIPRRWRQTHWQKWLPVRRVLHIFDKKIAPSLE